MIKWKQFADEKIKEIAKGKIVYDIGGCSRFQRGLAPYKEYFSGCDYKTIDIDPDCHPDILADAQNLPVASDSADGVICMAVLENVKNPFKAVEEIYRILKPQGKCFFSVPFLHPYYGTDFWRFSESGIRHLFREFSRIEICPAKGHIETIAKLLPRQKKFPMKAFVYLARFLDRLTGKWQSGKQVIGFHVFLVK